MLTFTRLLHDIGLRHWDLRGPAGLIRFEIAGIRHAAVYLHGTVAPGGAELTPCDLCGKCWHDAMTPDVAQALYEDWKTAAYHDAVIRTQLEKWYRENLERWAADAPESSVDQVVPANAPLKVTVADADTGEVLGEQICVPGDYVLIAHHPCYRAAVQRRRCDVAGGAA